MNFSVSNKNQYTPTFQRRIREEEKADFTKTMNEAFDYLGVKNRALIVHGSSFPSENNMTDRVDENYNVGSVKNKNPYMGTPYFNREFLEFVKMNGFNAIQLGPNGMLNKGDNSPYKSSIFAKNELFADYERLKTDDYANILSDNDTDVIKYLRKTPVENYDMSNFDSAREIADIVLNKAYNNFQAKLDNEDMKAVRLNNEFIKYKEENNDWLEKESIFSVLSDIHGTDHFSSWDNDLDRELISRKESNDVSAQIRYNQILTTPKYADKIDRFKFNQFILHKQEQEDKAQRAKDGIKYIGDLLVGYSSADEWSNPDAFMKDYKVGAMNGGKNDGPQLWGIPVLNPDKLFNEDGTLGASGQLLKQKIDKALEGVESVRVDNVMGLVDPFIYKSSAVENDTVENVIRDGVYDNSNKAYLSEIEGVDPKHNYRKILHKIVLPTLREHQISPKDVVFEDLGPQSQVFREVFYEGKVDGEVYEEDKLQGIAYTIGIKTENPINANYSFMSTHDNEPSVRLLDKDWIYSNEGWNPMYLAGFLIPPYNDEEAKKSSKFCDEIQNNGKARLKAKYAELFRGTPNIQVSFADFFGIDRVYNHAGRNDVKDNWKLRISPNYQDNYYESMEDDETVAMNMPELLELAVNSKTGIAIAKHEITEEEGKRVSQDLQNRLQHWKNVLKEPE